MIAASRVNKPYIVGAVLNRSGVQSPARSPWLLGLVVLIVPALVASCFKYTGLGQVGIDDSVYHSSILELFRGGNPYADDLPGNIAGTPFTYPPLALIIFTPTALLSAVGVHNLMTLITGLCVATIALVVARALTKPTDSRSTWRWLLAVILVAGALRSGFPVLWNLQLGQINVAITTLCLVDIVLLRRTRFAGVLIGLAAAIKVTPGLFIVYLLSVDRIAGIRAIAAGATFTLLAGAAFPNLTWRYFTQYLWTTDRVGDVASNSNVSITGVLSRSGLDHHAARYVWVAFTLVALAITLAAVRRVWAIDSGVWAACIIGSVTCLVAPLSWTHHATWFSISAALLIAWAARAQRSWAIRATAALLGATIIVVLYGWALTWNEPGAATSGFEGFVVQNTVPLAGAAGLMGLWAVALLTTRAGWQQDAGSNSVRLASSP